MITLTSARRRADELNAAVEGTAASPRSEVADLVGVVEALRTHAAATSGAVLPRPDFSARLREQLMAEAAETWTYDPSSARLELRARSSSPRRERRLVVAATALVLAGGSAGMAAAAQQALPGEALYPIKRGLEEVRTDLTADDTARGRALLTQADTRLGELEALAGTDSPESALSSTLEAYASQAREGSDLLITAGDEASVTEVRGFTQDGLAELDRLAPLLPSDLTEQLRETTSLLEQIDDRATEACPGCVPARTEATLPASYEPALDDAARVLASLDGAPELANDHPLISDRIAPPVTMSAKAPRSGDARDTGSSSGTSGVTEQPVPDDGGLLDDVEDNLGGLDTSSPDRDGTLGDTAKDLEDTTRDTTDTVKKAAEDTADTAKEALGLTDPRLP